MIQLLFALLAAEAGLVVVLLFRTPLRRLALLTIDRSKRGRGPIMVRTVAATMLVVLGSSGYSIAKIRRREGEFAQLTPTDQVLASRHLLEASLMGTVSSSAPLDPPCAIHGWRGCLTYVRPFVLQER
jgi:B-cell receptor-associated protein 31